MEIRSSSITVSGFTLYSHLSAIDVKEGESIKQKQILGRRARPAWRGRSSALRRLSARRRGPAGGVVGREGIDDNIQPKLEGRSGEIPKAQAPAPRKAASKRRR